MYFSRLISVFVNIALYSIYLDKRVFQHLPTFSVQGKFLTHLTLVLVIKDNSRIFPALKLLLYVLFYLYIKIKYVMNEIPNHTYFILS